MILVGHVIDQLRSLPAGSVHTCVSSPPYFGLRAYGTDPQTWGDGWVGELGSEPTPEQFVGHIVEVFAEVHRVLRDDGTLWVNFGDSFTTGGFTRQGKPRNVAQAPNDWSGTELGGRKRSKAVNVHGKDYQGLKQKDLVGIPWRVAFALQAWGWYLRSDIIWAKRSPMPESVTDRPCKSHEYVFLLSKWPKYFYDRVAVLEPSIGTKNGSRGTGINPKSQLGIAGREKQNAGFASAISGATEFRNLRSVWSLSNAPYKGAHFATFPPKLVIPCIKAGTSEKGCCPVCGAPWKRLTTTKRVATRPGADSKVNGRPIVDRVHHGLDVGNRDPQRHTSQTETTGWEPTCQCGHAEAVPCTVLDPFLGSGTTAAVAEYLGRSWVGCELNPTYAELARERIAAGYVPSKESKKRKVKKAFARLQRTLFSS